MTPPKWPNCWRHNSWNHPHLPIRPPPYTVPGRINLCPHDGRGPQQVGLDRRIQSALQAYACPPLPRPAPPPSPTGARRDHQRGLGAIARGHGGPLQIPRRTPGGRHRDPDLLLHGGEWSQLQLHHRRRGFCFSSRPIG